MGVQVFPALEGCEKFHLYGRSVDWKSLPQKLEELDRVTEQLGVEPLSSFVNCSRDEVFFDNETMEEFEKEGELIDGAWYYEGQVLWTVEPKWFSPDQGLTTISGLLGYLRSLQDKQDAMSKDNQAVIYS